jgi:hypothetical protein
VNYYLHYVLALDVPLSRIAWDCLGCPLVLACLGLSLMSPCLGCVTTPTHLASLHSCWIQCYFSGRPGMLERQCSRRVKLIIKQTSAIPHPRPTIPPQPPPPRPDTTRRTKSQAQHAAVKSRGNLRRLKLRGVCCSPIFVWF